MYPCIVYMWLIKMEKRNNNIPIVYKKKKITYSNCDLDYSSCICNYFINY
jgi:hypothetical protein